jgi:hypothetical protein
MRALSGGMNVLWCNWRKCQPWERLLLFAPMAAAAAATLAYNAATFGSLLRNGYKFWVAVPMGLPDDDIFALLSPNEFGRNWR